MPQLKATPPDLPGLRLDSVIGKGGMSVVWRGEDTRAGRPVAVKVLQQKFAMDDREVAQFFTEADTMTHLNHPGIVRGYGIYRHASLYYVVMELVDGYDLGKLVARKTRLAEQDVLAVAESVAVALDYAWENSRIVHCDIKPENIMVNSDGAVKVTDLGLCQTVSALKSGAGAEDEIAGTPAYISPEQIYGISDIDCRADIYSLGATMYHLASGHTLFARQTNEDIIRAHADPGASAPDPRHYARSVSAGFVHLLERMLVKDRAFRIQSWPALLEAVRRLIDGGEPDLPPLASPSSVKSDWV